MLTDKLIYVSKLVGGPVEVEIFDAKGKSVGKLPTPPVSSVGQMVHLEKDDILWIVGDRKLLADLVHD